MRSASTSQILEPSPQGLISSSIEVYMKCFNASAEKVIFYRRSLPNAILELIISLLRFSLLGSNEVKLTKYHIN